MQEMSNRLSDKRKEVSLKYRKGGSLQKSFSMGTTETNPQPVRPRVERRIRDEVEQPSTPPKTFVYKPQPRLKKYSSLPWAFAVITPTVTSPPFSKPFLCMRGECVGVRPAQLVFLRGCGL